MSSYSTEPSNPFFRLVILAGAAFVLTIFALLATIFGDPEAPVSQFLENYGGRLITCEVAAVLAIGLIALVVDRRQTLRRIRREEESNDLEIV